MEVKGAWLKRFERPILRLIIESWTRSVRRTLAEKLELQTENEYVPGYNLLAYHTIFIGRTLSIKCPDFGHPKGVTCVGVGLT